jgi:1,4-alpha-glucan branching enzyme
VANLSGADRPGYRIGVPKPGAWDVVLDTTLANGGARHTDDWSWHGFDHSLTIDLPALSVVWLVNR